jgi:septal ring factor EnvC (AmiA/AmiB activator)
MQTNTSAQDKLRQRNDLQREMIMKEGDYKKILNQKIKLEAEIRGQEKDEERIKVAVQAKKKQIEKIDQEIRMVEAELKNLKKKMNLI